MNRIDSKQRTRGLAIKVAVAVLMAAPLCLAAHSSGWDSVLERDEVGEPGDWCAFQHNGWVAADGGCSARHVGSNRSFFMFGDSFLTGKMVPNTMLEVKTSPAFQPPVESPWGTNAEFWARRNSGASTVVERAGLTSTAVTNGFMPSSTDKKKWYWPEDIFIRENQNKMVGIWTAVACQNGKEYGQCGGEGNNLPIVVAARFPKVCTFSDVSGSVSSWASPQCADIKSGGEAPQEHGIHWGKSINAETVLGVNYYYIYGTTDQDPSTLKRNVVLARATEANILTYTAWEFLKRSGTTKAWQTGPPTSASALYPLATHVNPFFTVDKITINNITRYVLVQGWWGWGEMADYVAVRIGKTSGSTALSEWHDLPASLISDANTWVGNIGENYGIDPPCGALAYAQFGQWATSNQAARKLTVSYYCPFVAHNEEFNVSNVTPADLNGNANPMKPACDPADFWEPAAYYRGWAPPALYGRIRFYEVDLSKLKPWCTGTGCWMP